MDLKVGVIGSGYWGKNLVRNFAELQALRIICDTKEENLEAQAQLYPDIHVTSEMEDVLANSDVQAVVIATPATLHYSHVKAALLSGKHVFVEKPLSLKYREGLELVNLADRRDLTLMVGHILEYHGAVIALKEMVESQELGQLLYLYSNRANLGKVRQEENILWSFAPHDVSVLSTLIGEEPISVASSGASYLQPDIVDITVTTLSFPQGIRAHIFVSWLHPYKEHKMVVIGDRKMAVFNDTVSEGKLKIYDKGIEWEAGLPVPREAAETNLSFDQKEPLRAECEHFLECISKKKRPLTDGRSALRVVRVLEAAQMSLEREGVPVRLDEINAGVSS
ncbi:MAG: Gfo/Idh/MocA family oxidoreductase [Acidobacteriota bacterium]|nr:Gfo/Idh/MocA family oxidoreductase [Acidobacteriota bacterium]